MNAKTSFHDFMLPIFISGAFVLVLGAASVYLTPALLERKLLPALPAAIREQAVLGLLFATALLLMPACKYAGTSELLGAFLTGLAFCTDHNVHATWKRQVKRVMQWLLRFFFACTIGFEIPLRCLLYTSPSPRDS